MNRLKERSSQREGAVIVLLVIMLPVLLILAAYSINIAYVEAVTADSQVVTDAAVCAAGRMYVQTGDKNAALEAAREAAARNPVAGQVVPINMGDLEFGVSVRESLDEGYSFEPLTEGSEMGNAVRLTTLSLANAPDAVFSPLFPTLGTHLEIRPQRVAVSTQSTMDVSLVIDRSGSMAYASDETPDPYVNPAAAPPGWAYGQPVPPNSRWLDLVASVNAFNGFLESSPQSEKLCLATYATEASRDCELTHSYTEIASQLDSVSYQFDGGGTSIGYGLQSGLSALTDAAHARPYAVRTMVLLTDGHHNTGMSPESMTWALKNSGVTLFTITFSQDADQSRMANLATACGGEHFHATDASQLQSAFEQIAKKLPSLMTQ
ncbi:MAG: VWA domain-containing protein [Rhodopirellula sp. JB055]|uniref:vWA domain-containing protein n=1 Tax=Rhodopirellula sp. JB055 TaxID=3342846 RepID=UPI00370AE789